MSWLDWLIVIAIILALIVVIKIVQKITAIIATIVISLILVAVTLYFLYQWPVTAPTLAAVVDQSSLGLWLKTLGGWAVNLIMGWAQK